MAKYRINTPDGSSYDVTAPDDASQSDVLAYAQAHHAAQAAPQPSTYNPTGISALDPATTQLGGFGDALQHHLMNAPIGLGQLAAHGVNAAIQGVAGGSDYAQGVQQRMAASDAQIKGREDAYQGRTAGNAGSWPGAVVGEVAPWMTGVGEARSLGLLPALAKTASVSGALPKLANIAKKAGLLSLDGGAQGATVPVTGDGSYGQQKAQQVGIGMAAAPLLGGATQGLGAAAGLLGRQVQKFTNPEAAADGIVSRVLDPGSLPALQKPSPIGVVPSVAEAAPSPAAVKLERKLRNGPLTGLPFANQDVANNAARRDVISGIAGTDEDMAAATKARFNATDPVYRQLAGNRVDVSPVMDALDALHNTGLGSRDNIQTAIGKLRGAIIGRAGSDGTIDADVLSGIRENASSHLGPTASSQEKRALGPIKNAIVNAIDARVPGYRANNQAFAQLSQPINTMRAGRGLLDAIDRGGRDAGGGQVSTIPTIRNALTKDGKARYPMASDASAQLKAVLDSLQARSALNNNMGASGPGTAADLAMSPQAHGLLRAGMGMVGGGLLGHMFGPGIGDVVGGGLGIAGQGMLSHANDRVGLLVAERMANAQKAAAAMQAAQGRGQTFLGRAANIPQYLLPYASR